MIFWSKNIVRDTPARVGRLAAILSELAAISTLDQLGVWLHAVGAYVFDLVGGPEIVQFFIRSMTATRPLTARERDAARTIFGEKAIRYRDIRVADGGIWHIAFGLNRRRAFATWHTINVPVDRWQDVPLIIHELTHVLQFEKVGSVYIGQGLGAQLKLGPGAYDYGGSAGLAAALAAGRHYSDYNREQQGQIAQDYCHLVLNSQSTSTYEPFIEELRAGAV